MKATPMLSGCHQSWSPRIIHAVLSQVLELQRRVQGTPHAAHLQIVQGDVMKV